MVPIRTDFLTVGDTKNVLIEIYMQTDLSSNESTGYLFWGISELSIIAVQCNTCVSDDTINLARAVGYALAGCVPFLILMVIIMCLIVQFRKISKR